jgi:hypothetical protein
MFADPDSPKRAPRLSMSIEAVDTDEDSNDDVDSLPADKRRDTTTATATAAATTTASARGSANDGAATAGTPFSPGSTAASDGAVAGGAADSADGDTDALVRKGSGRARLPSPLELEAAAETTTATSGHPSSGDEVNEGGGEGEREANVYGDPDTPVISRQRSGSEKVTERKTVVGNDLYATVSVSGRPAGRRDRPRPIYSETERRSADSDTADVALGSAEDDVASGAVTAGAAAAAVTVNKGTRDTEFGFGNEEDLYDEIGGDEDSEGGGGAGGGGGGGGGAAHANNNSSNPGGRRGFNNAAVRKQHTLPAPDLHAPDSLPIPALVRSCMRWLDKRNRLATEGIFREAGSHSQVQHLLDDFSAGKDPLDDDIVPDDIHEHSVATCMKRYLRESLSEAVLGEATASDWINIIRNNKNVDEQVCFCAIL